MMRKSLLAVFPVAPWPVRNNGISIRYYPILQRLAPAHDIDLLVLGDFRDSLPDDPLLKQVRSSEVHYFNRACSPGLRARLRTWAQVLSPFGAPYEYASYFTDEVYEVLHRRAAAARYDTLLWVCPFYREALDRLIPHMPGTRVVFDCVDSPLLHYVRADKERGRGGWLTRLDQWKTRRWERALARNVDACIYISAVDACAAFGEDASGTVVIPNGIFLEDLPSERAAPCGETYLGFLGHMGYAPNIEAALRLHDEIFRPLQRDFPQLKLMIIGRSPDERVRRLADRDVIVTGTVDNIWEYISKVQVFVFPLSSGAGLQNKLLEVMYAGKPVVTTDICRSSLGAGHGRELLAAQSSAELREQARSLLADAELAARIAEAGRAFVQERFQISRVLHDYESMLFPA